MPYCRTPYVPYAVLSTAVFGAYPRSVHYGRPKKIKCAEYVGVRRSTPEYAGGVRRSTPEYAGGVRRSTPAEYAGVRRSTPGHARAWIV
eukprot:gene9019-biopygen5118